VPGNVEPEAMSLDDTTLFLIEYVPAMHPTGYLLRRLDLGSGEIGDVQRVDQDETGVMHAVARTHVMARNGSRMYTLYTVPGRRAFVHVLDLRHKFAHCVDLPLPFGTGPQAAVALTLTPDGSRLFVADRHSGATAVIDTAQLVIDSIGTIPMAGSGGPAGAVMGTDGTLYLASDRHLVSVLPMSLDYQRAVELPGPAAAVGLGPSGEVVAGLSRGGGLVFVDPVTGRTTAHLRSMAFDDIAFIGAVAAAPLDQARTTMQCAC
jgi:YVTN family beta-propeller protein